MVMVARWTYSQRGEEGGDKDTEKSRKERKGR